MQHLWGMVRRIAASDVSVLITGESGAGKGVIARDIHALSSRRAGPFVKLNCAAFPAELLETELLGHERGAFAGADVTRQGTFEFAMGGTLLLDEIGEMPVVLQAKLLHVIEDRCVTRLGANRSIPVDVRVLSATNQRLRDLLDRGEFRPDLYYRLQVIELHVPPLRERRDEILPLARAFLATQAERQARPVPVPSPTMERALVDYDWPGNVRELENLIRRLVVLQDEDEILRHLAGLDPEPPMAVTDSEGSPAGCVSLLQRSRRAAAAVERDAIEETLGRYRWNRRQTARALGISYTTLLNKMKSCGITPLPSESSAV